MRSVLPGALFGLTLILAPAGLAGAQSTVTVPPPGTPPSVVPVPPGSIAFPAAPPPVVAVPPPPGDPHPMLPWGWPGVGAAVRAWQMPGQAVTVPMVFPQPGSLPPVTEEVTVLMPAYTVIETTRGYLYPGRWALFPLAADAYAFRWVPAGFVPK